jgi:hypothetical protein
MLRFPRYYLLSTAVLFMTLLVYSVGQRFSHRATSLRLLAKCDIPELADHLNRAGLQVRVRSSLENGEIGRCAFLTTTDKEWNELNPLLKDSSSIQQWHGTVSCERRGEKSELAFDVCDDHYLVAGPYLFYGDAALLERIRVALAQPTP